MHRKKADIEKLFRMYYRPLCLYSLHFTNDVDIAEDVVSECFVLLFEKLKTDSKPIENIKSYLYTMVKNHSLKTISKKTIPIDETVLMNEIDDTNDDLEERSFIEARLWNTIDNLPTNCREIFLMSKRDGMKYQEIADELNISIKTVENQISKALKRLKEKVAQIYTLIFL